ncbi:MAG TPA: phosphoenolpyruvate synthase [Myxococcota bacterium]|nr:phosphoenolpyruvate synthase [Myxococcota bacterium]
MPRDSTRRFIAPFARITIEDVPRVGGKNASLGEMICNLRDAGVNVPDGFAISADAFRLHVGQAGIAEEIYAALETVDVRDVDALARVGRRARDLVARAPLPEEVWSEIEAAYVDLSRASGVDLADVAVRSSATAEDLPTASFAGQQETFLYVRGPAALRRAVVDCMASLFTDRAIAYRAERGFLHRDVALSVGVQRMIRSACAGVIFTLDPESGFRDVVLVTGAYGLGETVVQGSVNPDEFWVHKPTLRAGFRPILQRVRGDKALRLVAAPGSGARSTRIEAVPEPERERLVLTDDEVLQLARWSLAIEDHYEKRLGRPTPMDLEWAKDGVSGELAILQARPETVHSQKQAPALELYRLRAKGRVLARGKSVGGSVAAGAVRILRDPAQKAAFQPGEILVTTETGPDWEPILHRAGAVVTDRGGRTSHAAIVSRELGIPCVVGTDDASRALRDGQRVTVSCAEGEEGRVYEGELPFERETIAPADLPQPRVPLQLNVGSPERAFQLAHLPSAGVGLARMELIVLNAIGVHPMALVHPERVEDAAARAEIARRTRGYPTAPEFFVTQLASGVARIAAAFHPRPVLLRFSDFKTHEYRDLLGGAAFEPDEANPMIGFRGASRYYSDRYRDGFALECAAVRRVRDEMGLTNLAVMVPFCRTLGEARRVLGELERNGLRRGERGLEIWVMCEIPSNAICAEEFAELFDGFSIGSNDLTQLTLGIDRDSNLLAELFDERDPAVKKLIESVVQGAHRRGRKVGICGQAPSDYPDFAEFLVGLGIDSISLNADAFATVTRRLAG